MRPARFLLPLVLVAAQAGWCVETDRQPDVLADSSWTVAAIGGREVLAGRAPTIEFRTPGQIAGSGGCNRYGGVCRFEENLIHITRLRSTRRACEEAVMEQEKRFLALLEASISWQVDGDTLVLDGPEGEIRAQRGSAEAAPEAP
jgi:heat shock protein HslJ